jgi:hypothetical protein
MPRTRRRSGRSDADEHNAEDNVEATSPDAAAAGAAPDKPHSSSSTSGKDSGEPSGHLNGSGEESSQTSGGGEVKKERQEEDKCPACKEETRSDWNEEDKESWVRCDACKKWFHWRCAGEGDLEAIGKWYVLKYSYVEVS